MKLSPQQYAQALLEALQEVKPSDQDKVLDNFVQILKQNGDLTKYSEIESEFNRLRLKQQGVSEVEVTMAREAEMNKGMIDEVNRIVGSKTEIKKKVDESILGGVVVRVDDTLIDASVKNQLENLNKTLKQ